MTIAARPLTTLFGIYLLVSSYAAAQANPDLNRLLADPAITDRLHALSWSASGDNFDIAQTATAGARGRHASSYSLQASWAPGQSAELDWSLHTHYPFPTDLAYVESLDGSGGGTIIGVDGFRPTPEGPLPPARVAMRSKLLWMGTPVLLLSQAEGVRPISGRQGAHAFTAVGTAWNVQLDIATGFPVRISAREDDPMYGTVEASMEYSAWTNVDGVFMPTRLEYRVDGQLIRRERRESLSIELSAGGEQLSAGGEARTVSPPLDIARFAKGWTMAHWFLSRVSLGGPQDQDVAEPVELLEVAQGVYQVLGGPTHSLVIESTEQLTVVDAPWYPERSEAVLASLRARWPDKPVGRLIVTHHHHDHSGGVVTFAAAGIPITVHALNRDYFFDALSRQGVGAVRIESVGEQANLMLGDRAAELYEVPSAHADGMLVVYLPDEAFLFNSDLYSPGRATQHPLWSAELLQAVRFYALPVERFAGAHGRGVESMEHLEQIASAQ